VKKPAPPRAPQAKPKHAASATKSLLWGGAALLFAFGGLAALLQNDRGPKLPLTGDVACSTGNAAAPAPPALTGPAAIAQYLDVSAPVGGFLEPTSQPRSARGILNFLAQTGPVLQESVPGATLSSWNFSNELKAVQNTEFATPKFSGEGSDIRVPIARVQSELTAGALSAAVIVTDLVGTCDTLGASCAAPAMDGWIRTEATKSGFFVGLLGVKAPYYGVKNRVCRGVGSVGCRFSENRSAWMKLDAPAEVPLYALVFARDAQTGAKVLSGLQQAIDSSGDHSIREVFTTRLAPMAATLACSLGTETVGAAYQLANDKGKLRCTAEAPATLSCSWKTEAAPTLPVGTAHTSASWRPLLKEKPGKALFVRELACAEVLNRTVTLPTDALNATFALTEQLEQPDWKDWSTSNDSEADSLGMTLRLQPLIELLRDAARPPARTLTCGKILPPPTRN